jgi:hypothetical protein
MGFRKHWAKLAGDVQTGKIQGQWLQDSDKP